MTFGEYTLFTSHIEAMENLEFFKNETSRKNATIESTPMSLIKYWHESNPEKFKGLNPYTFRFMIRG